MAIVNLKMAYCNFCIYYQTITSNEAKMEAIAGRFKVGALVPSPLKMWFPEKKSWETLVLKVKLTRAVPCLLLETYLNKITSSLTGLTGPSEMS